MYVELIIVAKKNAHWRSYHVDVEKLSVMLTEFRFRGLCWLYINMTMMMSLLGLMLKCLE